MNKRHTNTLFTGVCGFQTEYLDTPQPELFKSPNHPSRYPSDLRCLWIIIAQDAPRILVRIHQFSIERGYDFLTVGEGDDASNQESIVARLTGVLKLRALMSLGDKLWMQFVTDSSGTDAGFQLFLDNTDRNMTGLRKYTYNYLLK